MRITANQLYFLGAVAVILATFIGTLVAYRSLPATVPMHWNAHGQIDGWGPRWSLVVFCPGVMVFTVAVFAALPWLSPRKFEVDSFRPTYLYIMVVLIATFAYIQILLLLAALNVALDTGRAIIGGVCLLIALLGNVLGKVRRNFYVGIRTPWTLASERVWNATHRFGAKTFFVGGLLGFLAVLLRMPFWVPITVMLSGSLVPVIYSLAYYKHLEHRHELNQG
jgi:immunity protein, SdpI family